MGTTRTRAMRRVLGHQVVQRTSQSRNNRLAQDQRGVKQRADPLRGFGNFAAAARFCTAYDEQRNYLRTRSKPKETVSLAEQRRLFRQQVRQGRTCCAAEFSAIVAALARLSHF
jgi:putative transposase